jgi:Phage gp6-like head-tail connector protein
MTSYADRGSLELMTGPATEPVTLAEVKLHGRIDQTADDPLITDMIAAARQLVEKLTGRALITQTWLLRLDRWLGSASADQWWDGCREGAISQLDTGHVEIRKAPFLAITSVNTIAEDGTPTLWASSNYYATKHLGFGRLVKKSAAIWPPILAGATRQRGGIEITFTAGFGPNASDVPVALRTAIKQLVTHWYENRETSGASMSEVPVSTMSILQQHRVAR